MNLHSTKNIVRKKSKTGICHVMKGQESNTCLHDPLVSFKTYNILLI